MAFPTGGRCPGGQEYFQVAQLGNMSITDFTGAPVFWVLVEGHEGLYIPNLSIFLLVYSRGIVGELCYNLGSHFQTSFPCSLVYI